MSRTLTAIELSRDPEVIRAIAEIATVKTKGREIKAKGYISEDELMRGLTNKPQPTSQDIEDSAQGQLARIKRLEHLVGQLSKRVKWLEDGMKQAKRRK
jgi:hypothetical protein